MADILEMMRRRTVAAKTKVGAPSLVPDEADIIIFPGIRYERASMPVQRKASNNRPPKKSTSKIKRK